MLRPQHPGINNKRLYRLYTAEGLSVRKRKKTQRIGVRMPLVAALAVNQTWSMDFVSDVINRPEPCHGVLNASRWRKNSVMTTQGAYIESFNSTFRDGCLDETWFESL